MSRILLVEDHDHLGKLIGKGLSHVGIAADVVEKSGAAWAAFQQIDYQALILDRGLPDGDGLLLLRKMRQSNMTIPCLILTARDALHDRVEGLDAGADDYLVKPFAMPELIARVKALLRRPRTSQPHQPAYGDIVLSLDTGVMHCQARSITLAPAEIQIMQTLIAKQGNIVRRREMESAGWGLSDAVTPNALDVALHRLRRKLKEIGSGLQLVNYRSLGYALKQNNVAE